MAVDLADSRVVVTVGQKVFAMVALKAVLTALHSVEERVDSKE